ncbi:MAG TPA: SPOR domain-containing protein, partial [Bradyrhizobium sp.]|nr:SPOR domain-containing protein [Bradyrhizobium sp.]
NEPRKIKTFSIRGDQVDDGAAASGNSAQPSAAKLAPPVRTAAATPAVAPRSASSGANAPLSLAPQAAPPQPVADGQARVAAVNPAQTVPSGSGGGGYLVQVSSQRNEADAQASYRALQGKFASVLGSRSPIIKRADLGEKGIYYRAMVGPFGSPDEASQLCNSLKSAGGQCVVQRN